jgi:hypothetical protein
MMLWSKAHRPEKSAIGDMPPKQLDSDLETHSLRSSIRSPPCSKAIEPESSMYRMTSNRDSLTRSEASSFGICSDPARGEDVQHIHQCDAHEEGTTGREKKTHPPLVGDLVEGAGGGYLGGDHVEASRRVEGLEVLLCLRSPPRANRATTGWKGTGEEGEGQDKENEELFR